MRRFALILVLLFFIPSTVSATTGGETLIEVLGWDKKDKKFFYLKHFGGEGGDVPQLYFVNESGKSTRVASWYKDQDGGEAKFEARLQKLRKRLTPLTGDWTKLKWKVSVGKKVQKVIQDIPVRAYMLNATFGYQNLFSKISVTAFYDIAFRPVGVFVISDEMVVVVVRYKGIGFEGGYDVDEVLVLTKES